MESYTVRLSFSNTRGNRTPNFIKSRSVSADYVKLWLLTQRLQLYCTEFLFRRRGSSATLRGRTEDPVYNTSPIDELPLELFRLLMLGIFCCLSRYRSGTNLRKGKWSIRPSLFSSPPSSLLVSSSSQPDGCGLILFQPYFPPRCTILN